MSVTIRHIDLPAHKRVFAVSDVHGNLPFLQGLLNKISFSTDDVLILLGDLIEKGPRNLDTLRFIIQLCKTHTVHVLQGNCDRLMFDETFSDQWLFEYRHMWGRNMLMNELSARLEFPINLPEDISLLREKVKKNYPEEAEFLMGLPTILESDRYIFVHGGIPGEDCMKDPSKLMPWDCMKNDNFVSQGHHFHNKWCVVGHWPTTLYRKKWPCANPHISSEQQIVSIDGGCVIKRDGQLNALLLPAIPAADRFSWTSYDDLPTAVAAEAQAPSENSINIRFGDNQLNVLDRGEEFSLCHHVSSGRILPILTRHLWETERGIFCEDSTDYLLPIQPGDVLSIIEKTSRGILAKKNGVTGWYNGSLREEGELCVEH